MIAKLPSRIVCLTEETTELFYLLGEEDRIAGITVYTVRPSRAKEEKPAVSSFISGNIPKILALSPDLVIGFSDIQSTIAEKLIQKGVPVLVTNQRSLSEIFSTLLLLGTIVGKRERTESLLEEWKKKLEEIQKKAQRNIQINGGRKKRVFFQEWDEPIITGIQWVSEIVDICGGEDVFSNLYNKSLAKDRIVSSRDVKEANPEILLGSWCGKPMDKDWVFHHKDWQTIEAVKKRKVYEIDSSVILQPGPALFLEGIDRVFEAIWDN